MVVTLSDEARQFIARFEDESGATARDCLVLDGDDEEERLVFLVKADDMGMAIGSGGETVRQVEEALGRPVTLVEDADTPEAFVANALAPAAVYNVTISENDDTVAYVEVDSADTGIAIGEGGRNIAVAKQLAERHHGIDDIQLT
ncbi:NusA-like transcription termination signal-binding factor [Halorussus halophilus]|uniref:NusA-like transcription termination signal-binding factor n=1 Tax=Halorussus halophilus TaxID=2650975 RepID=UPI00130107FF|nr:NusA-like transcription termination signal-binding factor [Halorussus halophilus]